MKKFIRETRHLYLPLAYIMNISILLRLRNPELLLNFVSTIFPKFIFTWNIFPHSFPINILRKTTSWKTNSAWLWGEHIQTKINSVKAMFYDRWDFPRLRYTRNQRIGSNYQVGFSEFNDMLKNYLTCERLRMTKFTVLNVCVCSIVYIQTKYR